MKEKKRRSSTCNNCGSHLEEEYNFCPSCGQSNSDNNVTFSTLITEFLDNYFGIDSKMAHSFMPFLFKPGALTNRFHEGKVKHFIHPVRLYLVMSLFYFFTISYLLSDFNLQTLNDEAELTSASIEALKENGRLKQLPDSVRFSLVEDSLIQRYGNVTTFDQLVDSLNADYGDDFIEDLTVSLSSVVVPPRKEERTMEKLHRFARDTRMPDSVFWDSLSGGENLNITLFKGSNKSRIQQQVRKIFKNDEGFKGFVLGNLPLMMFILIPLFAGVLKLIYVRRKHLYIKHIVHALHIHSFAYLIYGLGLLIIFKLIGENTFPNGDYEALRAIIFFALFVLTSTYAYISFLKVYKQGWLKTLVKFNIVGFIYVFFLQVFFYLEVFISFWYY
ncbi:MAG: DUF3667 domain-containing protein [Cytophagia bacterium]|nr:DUF3667 domain-containing protein [Cytophagia bacterium]NVK84689.1 DUF3667 domain-containing protein [Cytophagia bacterium]